MLSSTASKVIEHVARPLSSWPGTEEQEAPQGKEGTKDLNTMAEDAVEKAEHAGDRGKQDPQPKDNYDVRMNGFAKLQE